MIDYEKKYKEALEWMKSLYNGLHGATKEEAEKYFPELKESEDEKIRKALVRFHKSTIDVDGIKGEDILAWLEKQKSVGEIVERCKNSWYNEGKIAGQFEGITDDEKYQQGWHDALEKQGKESSWKPTKEQYEALDYAYNSCSDTERGNYYEGVLETLIEDLHRLEKQGEQKPSWSDKDEKMFDFCCDYLNNCQIDWLKSLKKRLS